MQLGAGCSSVPGGLPVTFKFCTLTSTKVTYSQIEPQVLARFFAIVRLKFYLVGRHFALETDHLCPIDQLSVRVQWWIIQL